MTEIEYLITLLQEDISTYYDKVEEAELSKKRLDIFERIITLLKDFDNIISNISLINQEFRKIYSEKEISLIDLENKMRKYLEYRSGKNAVKLKKIAQKIDADYSLEYDNYNRLNEEITKGKLNAIESKKIIQYLRYNQEVPIRLIDFIRERLEKSNLSKEDIIITIEKIKIHNEECKTTGKKLSNEQLYSTINLIKQGYEILSLPEGNYDYLDEKVKILIDIFESISSDEWSAQISFLNLFNKEEKRYIYTKVMLHYQNYIYEIIEMLKDENGYYDADILDMIKKDYAIAYQKYAFLRTHLDKLNEIEEVETKTRHEVSNVNKLYYSSNSIDPSRCFFLSDLSSMREESYERVYELINEFKSGNKSHLEQLKYNSGYYKLKKDQVRIFLKSLNGRNYAVLGTFIKKSFSTPEYKRLMNRPTPQINDEYSMAVERELETFIKENGRKGKRQ